MKIVCLADTHWRLNSVVVPKGDILIHAGDLEVRCTEQELISFAKWLDKHDHKHKIVIAGNHDGFIEKNPGRARDILEGHCTYLENESVVIDGVKFYGSPITPTFGRWYFMAERGQAIKKYWDLIPEDTDVLITHGPPFGMFDTVNYANGTPKNNVGCFNLLARVKEVNPKLHIFGHIHEGHGMEQMGETLFINCTVVDENYDFCYEPYVLDMPS